MNPTQSKNRLLPTEHVPSTLWDREKQVLLLAPETVTAWIGALEANGLKDQATQKANGAGAAGGPSAEETDEHLTARFTGSAARVQLAMLNPLDAMSPKTSNAFMGMFAGGRVALIDLPCGSGAATISLLSTLGELRRQGVVPREPLDVVVVGGDVAPHALENFRIALEAIRRSLAEQALWVECRFVQWDVLDVASTAALIAEARAFTRTCEAQVLLVANFSDFLGEANIWDKAKPRIEEVFKQLAPAVGLSIWIEPPRKASSILGGLRVLVEMFLGLFGIGRPHLAPERADIAVAHPLRADSKFKAHLQVVRFDYHSLS